MFKRVRIMRGVVLTVIIFIVSSAPVLFAEPIIVAQTGDIVQIKNDFVKVSYQLTKGTYDIFDIKENTSTLSGAVTRVNDYLSTDPSYQHKPSDKAVKDNIGQGKSLVITSSSEQYPDMILEISLYEDKNFVVLKMGIKNDTANEIRVKKIYPLMNADAFASLKDKTNCNVLNSDGDYVDVRQSNARASVNNLLFTFKHQGRRHSLVMGGLTYTDFAKHAMIAPPENLPVCYLNAGVDREDTGPGGETLRVLQGEDHDIPYGQRAMGLPRLVTQVRHEQEVVLEASGLDPSSPYIVAFAWWDYYENHQLQSIIIADAANPGRYHTLRQWERVSSYHGYYHEAKPSEYAFNIPPQYYASGTLRIQIRNENGWSWGYQRYDWPYAIVNEAWLWKGSLPEPARGPQWSSRNMYHLSPIAQPCDAIQKAELKAYDPVGRLVEAGESYLPDDAFYVDGSTRDPFTALEQYGQSVRLATEANPNPYTFPTICAWYVQAYSMGPEINTTAGTVKEMENVQKSGFLKYSPVAIRLVPDKYFEDTEQGWWDDEHWQKYGHYTEPYETSEKWGKAIHERGGMPFTYFQTTVVSDDYAKAFPGHMINNDISQIDKKHWHIESYVTYDYTDPDFQRHVLERWDHLRKGGVKGVMFDYPMHSWLPQGGFEDKKATTTFAYREIFRLCRKGLGPDAYIHERNLGQGYRPYYDVTAGIVDSERVWGDASHFDPYMITKCGLRWYKARTLFAYDPDSKTLITKRKFPGDPVKPLPTDLRRTILTMVYVSCGRLLMADSFSDLTPEVVHEISRTFPYHTEPKSARPIDAFNGLFHPRVYDYDVNPDWHQVTFFNDSDKESRLIEISMSGERADSALGLDRKSAYHVYDFWNDKYVGKIKGTGVIRQTLRPIEARMMSVHKAQMNPQFISTNRHIMQGYLDMVDCHWDAKKGRLVGTSKVIGQDPYTITIATNGFEVKSHGCKGAQCDINHVDEDKGIVELTLRRDENGDVQWFVEFEQKT